MESESISSKTRKELREEYKQLKFRIGVFQIRNLTSGKIFINSSVNIDAAFNRHRLQLDVGGHPNTSLQTEWQQSGAQNFVFEILSELQQKDGETRDYASEVKELEAMFIEDLQPYEEKGYHRRAVSRS